MQPAAQSTPTPDARREPTSRDQRAAQLEGRGKETLFTTPIPTARQAAAKEAKGPSPLHEPILDIQQAGAAKQAVSAKQVKGRSPKPTAKLSERSVGEETDPSLKGLDRQPSELVRGPSLGEVKGSSLKGVEQPSEPADSVRSKRTVVTADIHERGGAKRACGPSPTAKRPLPQYSNATECKANEDINAVIDSDSSNTESLKDADTSYDYFGNLRGSFKRIRSSNQQNTTGD